MSRYRIWRGQRKSRPKAERLSIQYKRWGLEAQTFVFVFELGNTTASVEQALVAAGPCRVHGRVDVQSDLIAFGTPSGFHLKHSAIGQFDVDGVVFWVSIFSHDSSPYALGAL